MKKLKYYCIVALYFVLVFTSCGSDDPTLNSKAKSSLLGSYATVTPNVRNGVATLKNVIESEELKNNAEDIKTTKVINNMNK